MGGLPDREWPGWGERSEDWVMMANANWQDIFENASHAAVAAKEAEQSPGAAESRVDGVPVNPRPACECPICLTRRARDRAISHFDTFWRHQANEEDLIAIREQALKHLRLVALENGTEHRKEILRPPTGEDPEGSEFRKEWGDADGFQRYLARVLPEISSGIDGDPPTASAEWADTVCRTNDFLEPLTKAPEVTEGAASMSRRMYAAETLRLLAEIDTTSAMLARVPADDGVDAEPNAADAADDDDDSEGGSAPEYEQRWLRECFAEIANRAFNAGVLARAAAGKAIEADAVKKYQEAATNRKNGALGGQADKKARRLAVLNRLARANASKFTNATDAQRLRNAKTFAREYDKNADPKLFHDSNGKLLSDRWFKDWLPEYLALASSSQ